MGRRISAYLVYGFSLKETDVSEAELEADAFKEDHPGVGYLSVNIETEQETFLTTNVQRADLGKSRLASVYCSPDVYASWDRRLDSAAHDLGIFDHDVPLWLLIADVS